MATDTLAGCGHMMAPPRLYRYSVDDKALLSVLCLMASKECKNDKLQWVVAQVLDEIRPYLIGTGGGGLEHVGLDGPICKVQTQSFLSMLVLCHDHVCPLMAPSARCRPSIFDASAVPRPCWSP